MSILRRRIADQAGAGAEAMAAWHPVPGMVHEMPLTVVTVSSDEIEASEAVPLYTARGGAPVPATAPGRWAQVHAAGRP